MILRYDQGMTTHHEPIDHPLTETAAIEMVMKFAPSVAFQIVASVAPDDITEYARAAFDAGQKYQDDLEDDTIRNIMKDVHHLRVERDDAVARAERAEDRLSDSVHVDEAARRVEAAREQGWDDAAQHIYNKGWEGVTALRRANPHRPAPELPPERDGVVLVPADGHKAITTTDGQKFSRLTFTTKRSIWYGPNLAAQLGDLVIQTTVADRLTPGTWKEAGK